MEYRVYKINSNFDRIISVHFDCTTINKGKALKGDITLIYDNDKEQTFSGEHGPRDFVEDFGFEIHLIQ